MAIDDPLEILRDAGIECPEVAEYEERSWHEEDGDATWHEQVIARGDIAILALARLAVKQQTTLFAVLDAVDRFTNVGAWMDWTLFCEWLKATYPDLDARWEARDD